MTKSNAVTPLTPPAKRPVVILAGPYGHPFHPVLVTVPIGAWVASFVFDIASRVVADPSVFAEGSMWLIGIGVIAGVAAGLIGFLDLVVIPTGTRAFRAALLHAGLNLAALAGYTGSFLARNSRDEAGAEVPAGLIALSAGTLVLVACAGFLGGKLAFRYGVRVADEDTQGEGFNPRSGRAGRS